MSNSSEQNPWFILWGYLVIAKVIANSLNAAQFLNIIHLIGFILNLPENLSKAGQLLPQRMKDLWNMFIGAFKEANIVTKIIVCSIIFLPLVIIFVLIQPFKLLSNRLLDLGKDRLREGNNFSRKRLLNLAEEQYTQAVLFHDWSIRLKPEFSPRLPSSYCESYSGLGFIHETLGKYEKAIENYKMAEKIENFKIAVKNSREIPGIAIARVYLRQKNYSLADDWLWTILARRGKTQYLLDENVDSTDSAFYIMRTLVQHHLSRKNVVAAERWLNLSMEAIKSDSAKLQVLNDLNYQMQALKTSTVAKAITPPNFSN